MTRSYIPDAGDLIWLTFDPQAGRESRSAEVRVVCVPLRVFRMARAPAGINADRII